MQNIFNQRYREYHLRLVVPPGLVGGVVLVLPLLIPLACLDQTIDNRGGKLLGYRVGQP
jgi:hypothetical protein